MDINIFRCEECQELILGSDLSEHIQITHHRKFLVASSDGAEASASRIDSLRIKRKIIMPCLDMFGKKTKEAICFHLMQKYGIDLETQDPPLEELQAALTSFLGMPAARVLIGAIRNRVNENTQSAGLTKA